MMRRCRSQFELSTLTWVQNFAQTATDCEFDAGHAYHVN
jgi:hypothetical protein